MWMLCTCIAVYIPALLIDFNNAKMSKQTWYFLMQIACTYIGTYNTLLFCCALIHLIVHYACHVPFHCAVPTAPLNLTFPPGGVLNDSVTLTWLSPQHPSGVIRFYELQQSSSAGDNFVNTTDNSTAIVLSNLSPGTQYSFSVRALTVAFGPFSDELSVHTADGEDMWNL